MFGQMMLETCAGVIIIRGGFCSSPRDKSNTFSASSFLAFSSRSGHKTSRHVQTASTRWRAASLIAAFRSALSGNFDSREATP